MNNYKLIATDKHSDKPNEYKYIYYFDTLEEAKHAKSKIEEGGNKAKIKEVKGGRNGYDHINNN